jgi:hypothetical protein
MDLSEKYRTVIIDETLDLFDLLQHEKQIPPMFSCIQVARFCLLNVLAAYKRQDKEPPPELLEFLNTTIDKLMSEQDSFMNEQFLQLNTEGSA